MIHQSVIVFVKAPILATVKTRLARTIGDQAALELYRCFVADVLTMLFGLNYDLRLYFHPPEAESEVRDWLGEDLRLFPQQGQSLGEKMANALQETIAAGVSQAVLIGTDIPDLPPDIIKEAFEGLGRFPAVIGPSLDGGYYLIGFTDQGFLPDVFREIPWGTGAVLVRTGELFRNHGVKPYVLPGWRDIDTIDDLTEFVRRDRRMSGWASKTRHYLRQSNLSARFWSDVI